MRKRHGNRHFLHLQLGTTEEAQINGNGAAQVSIAFGGAVGHLDLVGIVNGKGGEAQATGLEVQKTKYGSGSLRQAQYPGACNNRCSQTQYRKPCMFFCQKCCRKCLCVPPGYYGNKQVFPCYNNWKTERGGPKCPDL